MPYIKIPKEIFDEAITALDAIKNQEKDPSHGGDGYAWALGACRGKATLIKIDLECYGKECK